VPCLKCGGTSEDDALLCNGCADQCLSEPKFFLNPVLIGQSVYSRLRSTGSAAYLLGPNDGSDIVSVPSADLVKTIKDLSAQSISHEDLPSFRQRCDTLLAHLGVPLKLDSPQMLLTDDATEAITAIVQKVNGAEKAYPMEGESDLYLRVGNVYWCASNGILFRTTSKKWREDKRSYLISRAKEYFSKIGQDDDLHSIALRNLGLMCLGVEEWTEAEEHLSDAIRHFPDDPKIGEGLARAHLMLGNQMDALSRADEVLNQGETAELWVLKGRILRDMQKYDEAVECFSRALVLDPKYVPAHDILIETLRDAGRMEEATVAESQRALSRRPDLEQKITELISEFNRATGEVEPVALHVPRGEHRVEEKRAPPVPAPPLEPLDRARRALKVKDYDSAIQLSQETLRATPDSRDATLILLESLIASGNLKEAEKQVHAFYERNRNDPVAWHWRGVLAGMQGKWGASVQYSSKAVTLDPNLVDAWISMGELLLEHGKEAGSDESFSRALQIDPDNPRAWFGKAKTMKQMGRWGAAIQCMDKYTSLDQTDKDAWLFKADTLFEKGKYSRAIEAYDRYISLVQDDSHALCRKGISLNALGMVDEARKCLAESVKLDPNNKEAAKWLKTIKGGKA